MFNIEEVEGGDEGGGDHVQSWVVFTDKHTKRLCYYNMSTEEQSWEKPKGVEDKDITFTDENHLMSSLPDPEGLDDDFAENNRPFIKPDYKLAIEHRDRRIFRHGRSPICSHSILDFAELSEAVALYFYLLRYFGITFLVMAVVTIPILASNYAGNAVVSLVRNDDATNSFYAPLAYFSLANLPLMSGSVQRTQAHGGAVPVDNVDFLFFGRLQPLNSNGASAYVTWLALNYIIMLCAWFVIRAIMDRISTKHISKRTITARNYTVEVVGLPQDVTEDEIVDHFSYLYDLQPDFETKKPRDFRGRKVHMVKNYLYGKDNPKEEYLFPTTNYSNSGNKGMFYQKWVADLAVANPIGFQLRTVFAHENLVHKLRRSRAMFKSAVEKQMNETEYQNDRVGEQGENYHTRRLQKIWNKIIRLENHIAKLQGHKKKRRNRRLRSNPAAQLRHSNKVYNVDDILRAYVTFNQPESARRCVDDYSTTNWYNRIFQEKELKFNGEHPLLVRMAPDPSDIIWENLEIPASSRRCGKCITCLITTTLLAVSFFTVLFCFRYGTQLQNELQVEGHPEFCSVDLPVTYLQWKRHNLVQLANSSNTTSVSREKSVDYVLSQRHHAISSLQLTNAEGRHHNSTCASPDEFINLQFLKHKLFADNLLVNDTIGYISVANCDQSGPRPTRCFLDSMKSHVSSFETICPCFNFQTSNSSLPSCKTMAISNHTDGVYSYDEKDVLNCYCNRQLSDALGRASPTEIQNLAHGDSPCYNFMVGYVVSRILVSGSVSSISVINLIIENIVKLIVKNVEHHSTMTKQVGNVMTKVFITMFINTAFILWFVNHDHVGSDMTLPSVWKWIFRGQFPGFTRMWYVKIGSSLTYTMMLDVCVPHAMPFIKAMVVFLRSKFKVSSMYIQRDLNELYEYPEFEFEIRLAYVLNTIAFSTLYMCSLPLLLPIAALSLFLSSWVDHIMLLRLYSSPPAYTKELIEIAVDYIPLMVLFSLFWNVVGPMRDFFIYIVAMYPVGTPALEIVELVPLWFIALSLSAVLFLLICLYMFGFLLPFRCKRHITKIVEPKKCRDCLKSRTALCTQSGKERKKSMYNVAGADDEPTVAKDIAFTENCIKKLSPYEEDVYLSADEKHKQDVLKLSDGWEVCKHTETGQLFKAVRWDSDGISTITGNEHKQGDFKRMFEWISEMHLFSYHIEHNPRYKNAVFALNLQKRKKID